MPLLVSSVLAARYDETFQAHPTETLNHLVVVNDGVVGASSTALTKFGESGQGGTFGPGLGSGFFIYSLAGDAAGNVLVGGEISRGGTNFGALRRLLPSGNEDLTFAPVEASSRITSILELSDSRILIGGFFTTVNGLPRSGIARLKLNGELDETFSATAGGLHGNLAIAPNGDYFASGQGLRRYAPDGTLLKADEFGGDISFFAADIINTPDGGMWVGRAFSSAKILADSAVDLSYANSIWPTPGAAAVLPDGRILVAGRDPARSLANRFVRLFADGIEDTTFEIAADREVNVIALGPDGFAYIAGRSKTGFEPFLSRIDLEDRSSSPALQFNRRTASVGEGNAIQLTVLRAGETSSAATARLTTVSGTALGGVDYVESDSLAVNFAPGETFKTVVIQTLAGPDARTNRTFEVRLEEANGAVIGTNAQVAVTLLDRQSVAVTPQNQNTRKFAENAGAVQLFIQRTNGIAYSAPVHWRIEPHEPSSTHVLAVLEGDTQFRALETSAFIDLRLFDDAVAGTNRAFTLTFSSSDPNLTIDRSNDILITVVENDRPGDPGRGVDGNIADAIFFADGSLAIGGDFRAVNGSPVEGLARLLPTGELDASFQPPHFEGGSIQSLAAQPDGKLMVLGSFTSVGGTSRSYLVRLNRDGSVDDQFNPASVTRQPYAMTLQPDGALLLLGIGRDFNGVSAGSIRTNLGAIVRLDERGVKDTNFATKVSASTSMGLHIASAGDGSFYVAGDIAVYTNSAANWSSTGQAARRYLARLTADGRLDPSFGGSVAMRTGTSPGTQLIHSLSVDTNLGSVLIAGNIGTANGTPARSMALFNKNGAIEGTFMTNVARVLGGSTLRPDLFFDGVLTRDSALFVYQPSYAGGFSEAARFNRDGTIDQWIATIQNSAPRPLAFWAAAPNGASILANVSFLGSRLAWFYPDGTRAADSAIEMGRLEFLSDGQIHVDVEGRSSGTLTVQRSSDFTSWETVVEKPIQLGIETLTIPALAGGDKAFFRAIVAEPQP